MEESTAYQENPSFWFPRGFELTKAVARRWKTLSCRASGEDSGVKKTGHLDQTKWGLGDRTTGVRTDSRLQALYILVFLEVDICNSLSSTRDTYNHNNNYNNRNNQGSDRLALPFLLCLL